MFESIYKLYIKLFLITVRSIRNSCVGGTNGTNISPILTRLFGRNVVDKRTERVNTGYFIISIVQHRSVKTMRLLEIITISRGKKVIVD